MTERTETELPVEISAGEAGAHATEAFALLGNETRLAILLALWEEYDPHATDNTMLFSELFERVAYDDPGSFSYHLQQLCGQFIRQRSDDEGYELRVPGLRFVQAVIAGAGVQDATLEQTEIDQACPFCEAPTAIQYRDGIVVHVCTECEGVTSEEGVRGFLSAVPFDPVGLTQWTPEEIRAASRVAAWRQTQFMFDGLCPACSSPVDSWLEACPDHDPNGICEQCGATFAVLARFECRTCKNHNVSSPRALALFHPAVIAFYDDHGVATRFRADDAESVRRVFGLLDSHEVTLVDTAPPRAVVSVAHAGDEVRLTFNETASVVEVER
jgi:hypothetical protein